MTNKHNPEAAPRFSLQYYPSGTKGLRRDGSTDAWLVGQQPNGRWLWMESNCSNRWTTDHTGNTNDIYEGGGDIMTLTHVPYVHGKSPVEQAAERMGQLVEANRRSLRMFAAASLFPDMLKKIGEELDADPGPLCWKLDRIEKALDPAALTSGFIQIRAVGGSAGKPDGTPGSPGSVNVVYGGSARELDTISAMSGAGGGGTAKIVDVEQSDDTSLGPYWTLWTYTGSRYVARAKSETDFMEKAAKRGYRAPVVRCVAYGYHAD